MDPYQHGAWRPIPRRGFGRGRRGRRRGFGPGLQGRGALQPTLRRNAGCQGLHRLPQQAGKGLGFNGWSLANIIAATADNSLFPDIPSRAKASKERKVALQLFDVFRKAQKDQKIKDEDLAKLAEAKVEELKPVLDYYDALPKK